MKYLLGSVLREVIIDQKHIKEQITKQKCTSLISIQMGTTEQFRTSISLVMACYLDG